MTAPKGWGVLEESTTGVNPGGWVGRGAPKYEAMHPSFYEKNYCTATVRPFLVFHFLLLYYAYLYATEYSTWPFNDTEDTIDLA